MPTRFPSLLVWFGAAALALAACRGDDDAPADSDGPSAAAWGPWARRLSAREIRNALADLSGSDAASTISFPDAPTAGGFDDVAEVAAIDPLLVERLDLAASLAAEAYAAARLGGPRVLPVDADVTHGCPFEDPADQGVLWYVAWTEAPVSYTFRVDRPGRYRVEAPTTWRGPGPGRVELAVDGVVVGTWDTPDAIQFELHPVVPQPAAEVELEAGGHVVTWIDRTPQDLSALSADAVPCGMASAFLVRHVAVTGPLPDGCADGVACAKDDVAALAARAWRRFPDAAERARLDAAVDAGLAAGVGLVDALAGAVHAALLSPCFLVVSDVLVADGAGSRLDDASIAGRLALLVWGSVPDDALLACAASGKLLLADDPCGLEAQLDRMLADPRATRFADGLVPQWLRLLPSPRALPPGEDVDFELLHDQMRAEAVALVQAALDDRGATVEHLLDATEGWVEPELAAWYGAPASDGPLDLAALGREGLLGLGAVHVATATATVPSPVKRGVWVRDVLLCDPPNAPPPGVPALQLEGLSEVDALTAFEQHASDPSCATCHGTIDPIGLATLGYDAFGRVRPAPLAPRALPDGTLLADAAAVRAFARRDDRFARCATAAVATYTLGRVVSVGVDDDRLVAWLAAARARGGSLADLLAAIARSDAFLKRAGEGG